MSTIKELPPTLRLVKAVWDHHDRRSWDTLNAALWDAYRLTIESGFPISVEELRNPEWDKMKSGYWIRSAEDRYGIAIACSNSSYIAAIEALWGEGGEWKPVIADDVRLGFCSSTAHVKAVRLKRCRLHVGAAIEIRGEMVTVTSRSDRGWNGVSYKSGTGSRRKIARRFDLTAEFIQKDRAERKSKDALKTEIQNSSQKLISKFQKSVKTTEVWERSSYEELQDIWDRMKGGEA